MGSEKSETAVLPIGLKLDELLEAGEEIFRDCENTDPKQRGSMDVLSLAKRIVELVNSSHSCRQYSRARAVRSKLP